MSDTTNGYHFSFFKPTTPQAKANRNMVLWLGAIWFVAIFGFHTLLWVIEKPTPESAYLTFQNVWENVISDSPRTTELQEFGQVNLSVLGKIALNTNERVALSNAMTWSIYELTADSLRENLVAKIKEFEAIKAEIENINEPSYIEAKMDLSAELSPILGLAVSDIRSKILPLELSSENMESLTDATKASLPAVMEKYLIHNQSFLTDSKFLGFPFHYFYTAIFLLVLFVGLCWLYCVKADQINAKFNVLD
jgi:putative solute:sodium symporter small subunit